MSKDNETHDVGTTGHQWDGIEELNNPLPRWWVWIFYLTILWGIWYTIAYPAWPGIKSATAGYLGYSTRQQVAEDIASVDAANASLMIQLAEVDLHALSDNAELNQFAVNAGAAIFRANCVQCHGSGAAGAKGYPNLLDDDWLWGGRIDEIAFTIANGIRNEDSFDARGFGGEMPAFGDVLAAEELDAVVEHVLAISGQEHDAATAAVGEEIFLDNCAACHGDKGEGSLVLTREYEVPDEMLPNGEMTGAAALNDAVWLFGGSPELIRESIEAGRAGVMPAWSDQYRPGFGLDAAEINAAAAYVHQLGGGQ